MAINRVAAIEMYTKNSAALTGGYDVLCASLDKACSLIRIINTSNKAVIVSYDGAHDNDYVAAGEALQLAFQTNNQPRGHIALLAEGQKIYVKGTAGTGLIYLAGYYNA
jgi:folate-dependent tRNA-U54 methylase TrmFO/GidA